jgi:kynureninase
MERIQAVALDEADVLAGFRNRFMIADETIYLDGNSLGRLPLAAIARLGTVVEDEWGKGLVGSWSAWVDMAGAVGDRIAETLVGAEPGEVVLADSTTVNLYKAASAALEARPGARAVVTDRHNFPTDRYVLEGLCRARRLELRLVDADPVHGPQPDDIAHRCAGGDVGLVLLSHVDFRSGALADMPAITAVAHEAGAVMLWDLCHSVGALPVDLEGSGAELAVGCTYKYLNGGPGAPAFIYVRRAFQRLGVRQPIWGWFGQRGQFEMGPGYVPVEGIGAWVSGTPAVLGMAAVQEGVELLAAAGIQRLRAKSVRLTDVVVELFDDWLAPLGFRLASPRSAARRGGHVAVSHPLAWQLCQALIDRHHVVPDFRPPDVLRLGPAAAYTRFVDVWDGVDRLRLALEAGHWRDYAEAPSRVT